MRRNALLLTLSVLLVAALAKVADADADADADELLRHITPGVRTMTMEVTAYCPCKKCCGKNARGVTASGLKVTHNAGLFVAADTALLPFHTKLRIPGYGDGKTVPVLDRGGAIKGNRIDVFFPSHKQALKWGRRVIEVTVVR